MANKGSLSNTLLGLYVTVIWGLEHLWDMPCNTARNTGRVSPPAKITAAWLDRSYEAPNVQVAVVDDKGRTDQMYFKNVRVFTTEEAVKEYMNKYRFLTGKRQAILELITPDMPMPARQPLLAQIEALEAELRKL